MGREKSLQCKVSAYITSYSCIHSIKLPFSILLSPKGWTDQELGLEWLKKDFEPASALRNRTGKPRLLILDGHNSHCTYEFVTFAKNHNIHILCLPSHTTHALQPCDVGVFGPLASAWKAEVAKASREFTPITKDNFLVHYHNARTKAMKQTTVAAAFAKTGIWPLNQDAIDPALFAPAQNTSTQPSQPIPAQLPSILVPASASKLASSVTLASEPMPAPPSSPTPTHSTRSTADDFTTTSTPPRQEKAPSSLSMTSRIPISPSSTIRRTFPSLRSNHTTTSHSIAATAIHSSTLQQPNRYKIDLPPPLSKRTATRLALVAENDLLRQKLAEAERELNRCYAHQKLMDLENGKLREIAFAKTKPKAQKAMDTTHARHLTSEENMDLLARHRWGVRIAEVHKEARQSKFKHQLEIIAQVEKEREDRRKEVEKAQKELSKAQKKAAIEAEKAAAKVKRAEEQAKKKSEKALEKAEKEAKKQMEKAHAKAGRRKGRKKGGDADEDTVAIVASPQKSPRKGASNYMAGEDFTDLLAEIDFNWLSDDDQNQDSPSDDGEREVAAETSDEGYQAPVPRALTVADEIPPAVRRNPRRNRN